MLLKTIIPNQRFSPNRRMLIAAVLSGIVILFFFITLFGFLSSAKTLREVIRFNQSSHLVNEVDADFQLAVSKAKNFVILKDEKNKNLSLDYFKQAKDVFNHLSTLERDPEGKQLLLNLELGLRNVEFPLGILFSQAKPNDPPEKLYRKYLKDITIDFDNHSQIYDSYLDDKIHRSQWALASQIRWDLGLVLLGALLSLGVMGLSLSIAQNLRQALRNEESLLAEEKRFRTVAETAYDAVLIFDEQGHVTYANPAVKKIFGYDPGEVQEKPVGNLLHKGLAPHFLDILNRHLTEWNEGEKGAVFEFVGLHQKGNEVFLDGSFGEFDKNGKRYLTGILRDVTSRWKIESELRESQARLSMLDEVTEESILLHDQGKIVEVNQAFLRMLGFERSEVIGKDLSGFMDPKSIEDTRQRLAKGYTEDRYEIVPKRKNGTTFPLEVHGRDFEYRGRKMRVSTGWDITYRKRIEQAFIQSEERFRRFAEVTIEGIFIHDQGICVDVNQSLVNMVGYSPSEIIGTNALHLLDEASADKVREMARMGYSDKPYELTVRRKDGSLFPAEFHSRAYTYEGKSRRVVSVWDITDRKKAEEALRQSELNFKSLIEKAPDGILLIQNRKIFYANKRAGALLGYEDPDALTGMDPMETVHPDDRETIAKRMEWAVQGGENPTLEVRLMRRDGTVLDVESISVGIPFEGRQTTMVIMRDITDRKQAEEALRRSEENFRSLIENSNDVISLVGADGKARYVSPSIRKVMGYEPEERIGHSFQELIHPEDQANVMGLFRDFAYKPGLTVNAEARALHKNGSWRHIEAVATNLLSHPGIRGIIFNYRDVTDKKLAEAGLKTSEENFRMLIEKSPDAMIVHRADRIYYVNPAFLKLMGYEKAEELIGRSPDFMMPPEERENIMERLKKLEDGATYNPPVERKIYRKDGTAISLEIVSFSIVFQGQLMAVAVMRDLTERKNTEQTLMKFERLSTIGEMAAGLAHEIRNPLASISTAAQLLGRKLAKEDQKDDRYVATILEQSERLEQLVRDTMDYARAEKDLPQDPFPLKPALESALRLCQVQFGPSHAKVKVEWDLPKKDLRLMANPQRIQQIFINLILNAYQAMPEGGLLKIAMRSVGELVLIRVEDSGPGITDENLSRVFEPFFTSKVGGSGLGLAISQKIANQYGGKITVERLSPKGTAFTFEVPMSRKNN